MISLSSHKEVIITRNGKDAKGALGTALLIIYVVLCLAVSIWLFYDGITTLHRIVLTKADLAASEAVEVSPVLPTAFPTASVNIEVAPSPSPTVVQCEHEYGEWQTIVAATVTSNGQDERVCAKCGAVDKRVTNPKSTIDTSPGNESVREMFSLINAERTAAGLNEVYYCEDIQAAVDLRATELNEYYDMQHNRPDGREAVTVFYDLGISYTMAGENYTLGPQSAEQAMNEFMNSQGHRELILSPNATGVALCVAPNDEFGLAWVQIFVK